MNTNDELIEKLPDLMTMLMDHLTADLQQRGDTWTRHSQKGQTERILKRIGEYIDAYYRQARPVPWLKIIGLCWIAIYRDTSFREIQPGDQIREQIG